VGCIGDGMPLLQLHLPQVPRKAGGLFHRKG
jgi:hypothetical protein